MYVIKNVEYNQDIIVGGMISFGLIIETDEDFFIPKEYIIPQKTCTVEEGRYLVSVDEIESWDDCYSGNIVVTNISDDLISDWELTICLDTEIISVWNGKIVDEDEFVYTIGNMSYNQNIKPKDSVIIGFIGMKTDNVVDVTKIMMTETMTADIVDNLIVKEDFAGVIPITDEYFISALYNMEDEVTAYLVQYYNEEDDGCGYVVVNNAVNSKEKYYIEFGYGEAPVIINLKRKYEELTANQEYKVLYLGGYDYYIYDISGVYGLEENEIYKLDSAKVQLMAEKTQYYNRRETLTYSDIVAKEVGYSRRYAKLSGIDPEVYITTADASLELDGEMVIDDHCSPTAGTNMLIYLTLEKYPQLNVTDDNFKDAFISMYKQMKTKPKVGTYLTNAATGYENVIRSMGVTRMFTEIHKSVTFYQATDYIDDGPVHLSLRNSQIYTDHGVLAVGYISFNHSSGWVSNYYQIVDGWYDDEYRYINHSLGIDSIHVINLVFADD